MASINDLMYAFFQKFVTEGEKLPVDVGGEINIDEVNVGAVQQGKRADDAEPWEVTQASTWVVAQAGRYEGISTDAKPSLQPTDRATFFEWDTQKLYYWDGTDWVEAV